MPFLRPTQGQLIGRVSADIEGRLKGTDARIQWSPERGLVVAAAGLSHSLHGHLEWIAKQAVPTPQSDEATLDQWGALFSVFRRPATKAGGPLTVKGLAGTVLEAGSLYRRNDGAAFATDAEVTMTGALQSVAITAVLPGKAGNTGEGSTLVLSTPVPGMQSTGVVGTGGLVDGFDRETNEEMYPRLQDVISQEGARIGRLGDYKFWAREVSGVTRAWERPQMNGAGSVVVFVMTDNAEDPFPSEEKVAEVLSYITERAPSTARLFVLGPTPRPLNAFIQITPDTPAVRAAVTAKLKELEREVDLGGRAYVSRIRQAISEAEGHIDHVLVSPVDNIQLEPGELLTIGTISWVPA